MDMKKWQCFFGGFSYDESLGLPEEGIAPGTLWENDLQTWVWPECGSTKQDFTMIEAN
ncbi:Rubredoxin-2 [compost metagenome]